MRRAFAVLLTVVATLGPARAEIDAGGVAPPQGIYAIVTAYPDFLVGVSEGHLVWRDGHRMPLADLGLDVDGNPLASDRLPTPADARHAGAESISAIDYQPIYLRMYGDCRTRDVRDVLVPVRWLRRDPEPGPIIQATAINDVAERLQRVSDELERLPFETRRFLRPLGGTFVCRNILFTDRRSLHGYGIAIDINPAHGDYWAARRRFRGQAGEVAGDDGTPRERGPDVRARIPPAIVEAFERHGFVWGGRWHRFDTFHFEYRPEYFVATGGTLPPRLTRETFTRYFGGRERTGERRVAQAPAPLPPDRTCHRWIRQPGPFFGRCLSRGVPMEPGKPHPMFRPRGW